MKRIVASIGVAALGAACVQSANAQGDGSKPWSLAVALRGFYDDNLNTSKTGKVDTFGGEINPSIGFGVRTDQTTLSLLYRYGLLYYDEIPAGNTTHIDQTHTFNLGLDHAFDERTTLSLNDSFVIGQEPDLLRNPSSPDQASFQRISGSNIRNAGNIKVNHQFSPKFGVEVGYANAYFNYQDESFAVQSIAGFPVGVDPVSNSGILDRIEQVIHADARWTIQPTTVGLVGYAFSLDHYTGDQPIGVVNSVDVNNIAYNQLIMSEDRNSRAHYLYAGVEHEFSPALRASLRAGARFTDYYNSPDGESGVSPYVLASLTYEASKNDSFAIGLSHDLSATDAFSTSGGSITSDSAVTSVYLSFTHRILPNLSGTLMGQFQNSNLRGGAWDGDSEQYYVVNASLQYQLDRHIFLSLSYNYDLLDSEVPGRGFDRNRVFLGATWTY